MAASMQWRKSLKFHDIFQYLRKVQENPTKGIDSKDLLAVRGCDIYVWNANGSDILTTNLKYIAEKSDLEKSSKSESDDIHIVIDNGNANVKIPFQVCVLRS
jgi:hypothetical protein